ncbi:hypothetical protein CS388_05195 [Porphyromonas gingivalis]|nr:hypothetical protein CS388_05195 [Porphyromonas gingivalis]
MVEGRVFATEPVSETYPIGEEEKTIYRLRFRLSAFFYPKNFTARRKAIFVRRMNKTNITCGYSDAINRDVREGVLSLESKIERYRKRRSLSLPEALVRLSFELSLLRTFLLFFEARQKGKIKRDKGQRSCSPRSCHRHTEEFE